MTLSELKEKIDKVAEFKPELMEKNVLVSMNLERDHSLMSAHLVNNEFFFRIISSSIENKRSLFENLG